jgi:hypothetical protein
MSSSAAQEVLVALDAVGEYASRSRGRRALQHEPALRSHRHDDGVLHHLRLHEAEDLGAEILRRSDQRRPAARDLAAAQVDRLELESSTPRSRNRARIGQLRDLASNRA